MSVVVTRMQDIAFELSKIFFATAGEGDLLPHPPPARPVAWRGAQAPRCWDPNLGPPPLFSRGCAPHLVITCCADSIMSCSSVVSLADNRPRINHVEAEATV